MVVAVRPALGQRKIDNSSVSAEWLGWLEEPAIGEASLRDEITANLVAGLAVAKLKSDPRTSTLFASLDSMLEHLFDAWSFAATNVELAHPNLNEDLLVEEHLPRSPIGTQQLLMRFIIGGNGKPRPGSPETEIDA